MAPLVRSTLATRALGEPINVILKYVPYLQPNFVLGKEGRTLPVPHPFLDNNFSFNVKLKNYGLLDFYDKIIDLQAHTWATRRSIVGRGQTGTPTRAWPTSRAV